MQFFFYRFPGESDIDQLFQIVRILGKLSSRHQILIMRNAMFRGMKQEQNTSLLQMFPNWNRDSVDFLSQCLKMDGNVRLDTVKLLKHDLFLRDNFLDNFLIELRSKLAQEMQINPLLKRIPSYSTNSRRNSDEKKSGTNSLNNSTSTNGSHKKANEESKKDAKAMNDLKSNKMNLSVLSTQLLQPSSTMTTTTTKPVAPQVVANVNETNNSAQKNKADLNALKSNGNDEQSNSNGNQDESEYNPNLGNKQQRTSGNAITDDNNHSGKSTTSKSTAINNGIFKDNSKQPRVLSAKLPKSNDQQATATTVSILTNNHPLDMQFQPPSPLPFQSLQSESPAIEHSLLQTKRLSPHLTTIHNQNSTNVNSHGNGFTYNSQNLPQYFNFRRHSNILGVGDQMILPKNAQFTKHSIQIPFNTRNNVMPKRERNHLLDTTLQPLNSLSSNSILSTNDMSSLMNGNSQQLKDASPRILPPPQWLTGNLKFTTHGKGSQISNAQINGSNVNGKRRITDWKTVGNTSNNITSNKYTENSGNDLILPNCPGATISPKKSNSNSFKKKLSTLSNLPQDTSNALITH